MAFKMRFFMKFKIVFLSLLTTIASLPVLGMEEPDIEAGLRGQFIQHAGKVRDRFEDEVKKLIIASLKLSAPSAQTTEIAHKALRDFGINPQEVFVAEMERKNNACAFGGMLLHSQKYIIFGQFTNIPFKRHTAYHEAAHLHHNDVQSRFDRLLQSGGLVAGGISATMLFDKSLKANVSLIPTRTGRALATVGRLAVKCGGLYSSYKAGQYYNDSFPCQQQEMRADTVAYQKLLTGNDLEACVGEILWQVERFETSYPQKKAADRSDSHPAPYERAANGVKILREAGIDFTNLQGLDPDLAKNAAEKVNQYFPESK
jgi:hypothetical protein